MKMQKLLRKLTAFVPDECRDEANVTLREIIALQRVMGGFRASPDLDSLNDGVIVTDAAGLVTFMNPVCEALSGWQQTDAIGRPFEEVFLLISTESGDVFENPVREVLRTGAKLGVAKHTLRCAKTGREMSIVDSAEPICDETGAIAGVVVFFQDQTEKERGQAIALLSQQLTNYSRECTPVELLTRMMAEMRAITKNVKITFKLVESMLETPLLRLLKLSPSAHLAEVEGFSLCGDVDETRVWSDVIQGQKTVVYNDCVAMKCREEDPSWATDLKREMVVPVVRNEKTIAFFAMGNKADPYTENDVRMAECLVEMMWEILERKQVRVMVQESEKKYLALFENMSSAFILNEMVYDEEGTAVDYRILSVNPTFCKLLNIDADTMVGRLGSEVFPVPAYDLIKVFEEVARGGAPAHFDYCYSVKDRYYELKAFHVEKDRFALLVDNITDRKRAENELRKSEEKYRALFEQFGDAFLIIKDGRFIDCNQAAVHMLRCNDREDILGTKTLDWSPEKQPDGTISADRVNNGFEYLGSGNTMRFEWCLKCRDGELLPIDVSLAGVVGRDGQFMAYTAWRDITERKRMQEAFRRRVVALTQPMELTGSVALDEFFNLEILQQIQDEFSAATGVSSLIVAMDGTAITQPSGFSTLCSSVIRQTEKGLVSCVQSDAELGRFSPDGPTIQHCASAGILHAGVNILVGNHHVANWLIGQVCDVSRTEDEMRAYARRVDVDEEVFLAAYREIPIMSRERFGKIAQMLFSLVKELTTIACQNVQQARFIAAQQKAEAALHESREHLEATWNAMDVGVMMVDAETQEVLRANPALYRMCGRSEKAVVGKQCSHIFYSEVEGACPNCSLGLQPPERSEQRVLHADGHVVDVEVSVVVSTLEGRQVYTITMVDVSERKQADIRIRRLFTAMQQSPEMVMITDVAGQIEYVNPAFEKGSGYTKDELLGREFSFLKSGAQSQEFYVKLWMTLTTGSVWKGRLVNRHKNDSVYTLEAIISPVKDAEGKVINYVGMSRDISMDLTREEELRQAQKMEAVGKLAGGIAHDFNNLLQVILGFSEILHLSMKEGALDYDNVSEIIKAARHATDLTGQLLAFSRKQPAQLERLNLNTVIFDSEVLLEMLMGHSHEVSFNLAHELPEISLDRGQFTQVLMNLAVNARDAMPDGGCLSISTEQVEVPFQHKGGVSRSFVCTSFADTGSGMLQEVKEHLFDPFFTTKEVGRGTGLGLSVVYGIVSQYKGWIQVESEIGVGSCFKIYLPAIMEGEPDLESDTVTGTRVLLVEDDPSVCKVLLNVLQNAGYEVLAAANAEEALTFYKQEHGRFDLLMSDVKLPGMDGDALADRLKDTNPNLPILLCSSNDKPSDWYRSIEGKGYFFLEKPFTLSGVLDSVNRILNIRSAGGSNG